MIYYLSELDLSQYSWMPPMRLLRYVTFRAGGAAFSAFVIALVFGPLTVHFLKDFVAPNRLEGLVKDDEETKARKKNVPSMGGILILGATIVSILMWAKLSSGYVIVFLCQLIALGALGFLDDYLKVKAQSRDGLSSGAKLAVQVIVAVLAVYFLDYIEVMGQETSHMRSVWVPFWKSPICVGLPLVVVIAFGTVVLVGSSNAVNLSDGMDGLATGCTVICALAYALFAYVCGHYQFANYLDVPFIKGCHEVVVVATAIAGACLGFLWWNCNPASMFMGDTGSLALGGAIGLIAVLVKQEILLVLIGGIFVLEAGSVILQVSFFKLTRKFSGTPRRLFKCAPIHHHFKQNGWTETQVVIRFWIIAAVLAGVGMATLKLR